MDVSFYIGELLEQQGEVSVPGLGYLVLGHVPSRYVENEGKFYPPGRQVQFDPQEIDDDDTLTQYIADKKNISLASSKYFTEKYIATLKEDALVKDVPVANLGSFYTEQGRLMFRPAQQLANDSAFFGYQPVNITRVGQAPVTNTPPPFTTENTFHINTPQSDTPVRPINPPPYESLIPQQDFSLDEEAEAEEEHKSPVGRIVLLALILVLALGVLGLYKYAPDKFEKLRSIFKKSNAQTTAAIKAAAKPKKQEMEAIMPARVDSAKADSTKKVDSIAKATPLPPANNPANPPAKTTDVKTGATVKPNKTKPTETVVKENKTITTTVKQPSDKELQALAAKQLAAQQAKDAADKKALEEATKKANAKSASKTPPVIETKKTKTEVIKQEAVPAATPTVGTGDLTPITVTPGKTWFAIAKNATSDVDATATMAALKKKGIDAFIAPNYKHNGQIYVATGAYATNPEAEKAANALKSKGFSEAYLNQINPRK